MKKKSKVNEKAENKAPAAKAPVIPTEPTAPEKKTEEQKPAAKGPVTPEGDTLPAGSEVGPNGKDPLSEFLLQARKKGREIVAVTDPKGKLINAATVEPGVVQKTESIFYINDCVSGEWLYCFPERYEKMKSKGVDFTNYAGRESKAQAREAAAKDRIFVRAAKAKARYEELQKLADEEQARRDAAEKTEGKGSDTSDEESEVPTQAAAK